MSFQEKICLVILKKYTLAILCKRANPYNLTC